MESTFIAALQNIATPEVLLVIFLSALYGLFVGSIPGLTATMAVALLIPLTFYLDNLSAIAAIVTLEACSIFAGDIPTTLVRIPGTPSSAAYTDDAYALTQQGLHEKSLGVSLVFSVAGGLFGALVLIVAAPLLAKFAFYFTTYEYFWLYVLGLSCAAIVSTGSRLKGLLALMIGLMFSTIGLSEVHSLPRFTFGYDELFTGINFIPAMIGLFGLSEVLRTCLTSKTDEEPTQLKSVTDLKEDSSTFKHFKPVFGGVLTQLWKRKFSWFRSSCIGSTIGMIPGAGADIAAWISYAASKITSKTPEEYGKGSIDAVGDATSANNSALAGAWIPTLVLGIPGDSVTAIVIGVLMMKNITPGIKIFENPDQLVLVHGIYLTFIIANLLLIPLGFLAIRSGSQLVRVPRRILMPLILIFCVVGAYSINGSYFDVWVMLGMGVIGFVLDVFAIPLGPVVLGIILGGQLEQTFVQNLTKDGSLSAFFSRPVSAALGALCLALWLVPVLMPLLRNKKQTDAPR